MNNRKKLAFTIAGIMVTLASIVFLALSLPTLAANPESVYSSQAYNDPRISQALNLMILGLMLMPFGLLIIFRGRKRT